MTSIEHESLKETLDRVEQRLAFMIAGRVMPPFRLVLTARRVRGRWVRTRRMQVRPRRVTQGLKQYIAYHQAPTP